MISISFSEAYALFGNKNKKFKTLFINYIKNIFSTLRSGANR
ncbi:hypothetical protein C8K15_1551 [Paenisporosarcina sp. OV554]|nr:hypothetical protein C8K15_1551 [Paenisporosarcina sp. OV554]